MYSTPKDLLVFDQAIFNHTLIKKTTMDIMLTPYQDLEIRHSTSGISKRFGSVDTLFAERQNEGYGHSANWVHLIDKGVSLFILSKYQDIKYLNKMRKRFSPLITENSLKKIQNLFILPIFFKRNRMKRTCRRQ
jgi:hypothetical protein